jgi:hypothetical protein
VSTVATQTIQSRWLSTRTIVLSVLAAMGIAAGITLMVQSVETADEPASKAAASFSVEAVNHARALNVPASEATTASSFTLDGVLNGRSLNEVEASIDPALKAIIDGRALNEVGFGTSRFNLDGISDARALNTVTTPNTCKSSTIDDC